MMHLMWLALGLAQAVEVPTRAPDTVVKADLSSGAVLEDLSWAQNAAIACLPSTRWRTIRGSTVFVDATVPVGKTAIIRAVPASGIDLSLYVFVDPKAGLGASTSGLRPPKITSARNCAKSYWEKAGVAESVEISAYTESQNLVVAVAGATDVLKGGYTLEIWYE